jgi:hypothetical protein
MMKILLIGLTAMTVIGIADMPYWYYIVLKLSFITAFFLAYAATQNGMLWSIAGWSYILLIGLPKGVWIAIDIVCLILLFHALWGEEMKSHSPSNNGVLDKKKSGGRSDTKDEFNALSSLAKTQEAPRCQDSCRCAKKVKWREAMEPCCTSDEGRPLGVAD